MEAYLKKLCFEYQVDEREVKELLARMEMVYLDKCAAYYISEEEIEELCASSISFANLVRQLMEYQFYFKEEEDMNARKLTVRERYLSLLAEIPDILYRVPLKHINHYLGADVTSLGYLAGSSK